MCSANACRFDGLGRGSEDGMVSGSNPTTPVWSWQGRGCLVHLLLKLSDLSPSHRSTVGSLKAAFGLFIFVRPVMI
jgi:hypothetical protein